VTGAVPDHPFQALLGDRRRRLLAGARGRVLDVGTGTVRNLPHYPLGDGADEVHDVAVDELGRLEAGSFDTVVCSLVLCSVDDQAAALAAIARLVRREPDGRLLFLEHVRMPGVRGMLQAAATPVWSRIGGGCHLDRDTLDAIRAAGFAITDCERSGALVQGIAQLSKRSAGVR
jgi:SAM-dependent methyltransferase